MDHNERPTTAEEYKRIAQESRAQRKSYLFRLPSGNRFEIIKIELIEAMSIYRLLGINMGNRKDPNLKELMTYALLDNLIPICDKFLPAFIKSPRIYPSNFEGAPPNALKVTDMEDGDLVALVTEIISKVSPGGAKAKAEAFPGGPDDKNGEPPCP